MKKYCYICGSETQEQEFKEIDSEFEILDVAEFVSIIEYLGLHHCDGSEAEFTDGTANVCKGCFKDARENFQLESLDKIPAEI